MYVYICKCEKILTFDDSFMINVSFIIQELNLSKLAQPFLSQFLFNHFYRKIPALMISKVRKKTQLLFILKSTTDLRTMDGHRMGLTNATIFNRGEVE